MKRYISALMIVLSTLIFGNETMRASKPSTPDSTKIETNDSIPPRESVANSLADSTNIVCDACKEAAQEIWNQKESDKPWYQNIATLVLLILLFLLLLVSGWVIVSLRSLGSRIGKLEQSLRKEETPAPRMSEKEKQGFKDAQRNADELGKKLKQKEKENNDLNAKIKELEDKIKELESLRREKEQASQSPKKEEIPPPAPKEEAKKPMYYLVGMASGKSGDLSNTRGDEDVFFVDAQGNLELLKDLSDQPLKTLLQGFSAVYQKEGQGDKIRMKKAGKVNIQGKKWELVEPLILECYRD